MTGYEEKRKKLLETIREATKEDVMLAFSGGVDSSLLLKAACEAAKEQGTKVYAVTIHTALHPAAEAEEARKEAEKMGAVHRIIQVDELSGAGIEDNPTERCYRCKRYMFGAVKELALELGIRRVMEGTNAEDQKQYRPGIRAIQELGFASPLLENGFTKTEVRRLAAEYGISASDKPSTPCLATRFPYGTRLDYREMRKVEAIEDALRGMGFYNVRARIHGDLVRIEVDAKDIGSLAERREEVVSLVKEQCYLYVSLDLEGFRSGSQDVRLTDLK